MDKLLLIVSVFLIIGTTSALLSFDSLTSVTDFYTGISSKQVLRGIYGAGESWNVISGEGKIKKDGTIKFVVTGLVLNYTKTNLLPSMRVLISCLTDSTNVMNILSEPFDTNNLSDFAITTKVDLPPVCYAPLFFITTIKGDWIATIG